MLSDPHSFADDAQPSVRHMVLDLELDFAARVVRGTATLELDKKAQGALDLDTRDLVIGQVSDPFELSEVDPIKGQRLRIQTTSDRVTIDYETSPGATALQWLDPSQTMGGEHPYVFTQCQAIHARSVMPCQDTPRVRSTYACTLRSPLPTVMAAAMHAEGKFEMPQPIPSYLFAFASGNIVSKDLGPRSKIYCEPEQLDAAAWEFEDVDVLLTKAEALFGPYPWDRFDLLVMPPSFPYGGMENPRLTFLTPTLLAKDKSLVSVVAHELAHSWTGNLVTNASMDHFWLNEGWTVYAERRILEAIEGKEVRALHASLGRLALEEDVKRLAKKDEKLTCLENDLTGTDPDEVYSQVPYEKGFLFLWRLEEAVGRDAFDEFIGQYIDTFRFKSITTKDFLSFLSERLDTDVDVERWVKRPGIPEDAPNAKSERLKNVLNLVERWKDGQRDAGALKALDSTEWQLFLGRIDKQQSADDCRWMDETFGLTGSSNYEIRVGWLTIAAASGYAPVHPAVEQTLVEVGRMKYLRPLYDALITGGAKDVAERTFARAKDGYHPVAKAMVDGILA